MAIFKAKVSSEYTVIPNRLLKDERLSFESKGLLCLLLSLPEDWKVNKEWIISQSNAGRDKITRILRELQEANYISKMTTHDEAGKITGIDWAVYPYDVTQRLIDTVERETRTTANPDDGKPTTTKERILQSKDNTNIYQQIADEWNDCFKELANVKVISDKRKSAINASVKLFTKDYGLDKPEEWRNLFDYAKQSNFLMGKSSDFQMTFDFVINKNNLLKIIEGNYDN